MAKELNAERVSPITRANYSGNGAGHVRDENYDPLTALANLVGNIESDVSPVGDRAPGDVIPAAIAGQAQNEAPTNHAQPVNPLEALVASPDQNVARTEKPDLSALEAELSMVNYSDQPSAYPPAAADNATDQLSRFGNQSQVNSEPVRESFAALHSAFGTEENTHNDIPRPQTALEGLIQAEQHQVPGASGRDNGNPDFGASLLQEIESSNSANIGPIPNAEPEVYPIPQFNAPDMGENQPRPEDGPPVTVNTFSGFADLLNQQNAAQSESPQQTAPVAENPVQAAATSIDEKTTPPVFFGERAPEEPVSYAPVDSSLADSVAEFAAEMDAGPLVEPEMPFQGQAQSIDDSFTAEFEAAMAGSTNEFHDAQPGSGGATPQMAAQPAHPTSPEYPIDEDKPFGSLSDNVAMPPVNTPFDNQVDSALNEILDENVQADSELGWSGELAGELAEIVSNSPEGQNYQDATTPPAVENFTNGNPVVAGETVSESPFGPYSEPDVDIAAFEQDLADQFDTNGLDEPLVAVPEVPQYNENAEGGSRGKGVVVGVVGLAAVVAVGVFGWNYFTAEPAGKDAKIILASSEPIKIKPKDPGGTKIPNQDQVVFKEVNGETNLKTNQERLTSGTEAPIRVVTTDSVPPVVQPLPVNNSSAPAAKSAARIAPDDTALVRTEQAVISPRRVRTVVVRPDGTIVSANSAKKAEPIVTKTTKIETSATTMAMETTAATGTPVETPVVTALPPVVKPLKATRKIDVVAVPPNNTSAVNETGASTSASARSNNTPTVSVVKTKPVKKKVQKPRQVQTASVASGSYVMQISSQRSAEAAQSSYNRLSRRFPGILGGKGVDIRRFNIKDKGIFYRVRVPVGSKSAAINLCTRYKSAGGSCFVTR